MKMWLPTVRHAHLEVTVYHDLSESTNQAVPKLSRLKTPLMSQQIFHSASRPKEIPDTPVYYVVRSKQLNNYRLTFVTDSGTTFCNLEYCVSLENLKYPAPQSLAIGALT